jgi:hypothetical protein
MRRRLVDEVIPAFGGPKGLLIKLDNLIFSMT